MNNFFCSENNYQLSEINSHSTLDNLSKEWFGDILTWQEWALLTGAPSDSKIKIDAAKHDVRDVSNRAYGTVVVSVQHKFVQRNREWNGMQFSFYKPSIPAAPICSSLNFLYIENDAPQGTGTKIFANAVRAHRRYFPLIEDIQILASRSSYRTELLHGKSSVGYFVWPILGADVPLTQIYIANQDPSRPLFIPPAKWMTGEFTLQDFFQTEDGRQWWYEYGTSAMLTFDLTDSSRSMQILEAYLQRKNYPITLS